MSNIARSPRFGTGVVLWHGPAAGKTQPGPIDIFDIIWIITIYVGSAGPVKGPATPHREPKHEDRTFKVQPPPRRPVGDRRRTCCPRRRTLAVVGCFSTSNGNPPAEAGLVNDGTAGTPYSMAASCLYQITCGSTLTNFPAVVVRQRCRTIRSKRVVCKEG